MRLRIDRDGCIGTGNCVKIAPDVFQIDELNKSVMIDQGGADEATMWDAARSCPVDAIILEDDLTGEQLYPKPVKS